MPRLLPLLALLGALAVPGTAAAHTQSYGFLAATLAGGSVTGTVDLAVRDLDAAAGLDADGDGRITWGEVRARESELAGLMVGGVSIGPPGAPCTLEPGPLATDTRGGETYLVAPFSGPCAAAGPAVDVGYDLLFAVDAQHRGLVSLTADGRTSSLVMTPAARHATVALDGSGTAATVVTFVGHGIHHILIGYDHILFVITLMLGAVVIRRDGRWQPVGKVGDALLSAARLVTAFTLAHSVTLALAAFDVIRLPPALTESAIAATIALAALNTIVPVVTGRIWLLAFGFGLVHGFGFANVLAEMALPTGGLVAALFAFNLGVEIGQLAIVAAVLPVLVLASRSPAYPRVALPALSLAIAAVGTLWLIGRAFGVVILPIG